MTIEQAKQYVSPVGILQCIEDAPSDKELARAWDSVKPLLQKSTSLHSTTIQYWSCDEVPIDEGFRLSRYMRDIRIRTCLGENGA